MPRRRKVAPRPAAPKPAPAAPAAPMVSDDLFASLPGRETGLRSMATQNSPPERRGRLSACDGRNTHGAPPGTSRLSQPAGRSRVEPRGHAAARPAPANPKPNPPQARAETTQRIDDSSGGFRKPSGSFGIPQKYPAPLRPSDAPVLPAQLGVVEHLARAASTHTSPMSRMMARSARPSAAIAFCSTITVVKPGLHSCSDLLDLATITGSNPS